jgi:hypothetical protein
MSKALLIRLKSQLSTPQVSSMKLFQPSLPPIRSASLTLLVMYLAAVAAGPTPGIA